jgi:hypothetical protein
MMKKQKKALLENCSIDPQTGKELFKPQTNTLYKSGQRPTSQQKISTGLYDRHK